MKPEVYDMRIAFVTTILLGLACGTATRGQEKLDWKITPHGSYRTLPVTLIPVGDPKKDKLPDVKDVWSGLAKGMAKDADTQKLLKKLLNCEAVAIAVLPKDADGKYRPTAPAGKSRVFVGIRLSDGVEEKDDGRVCFSGAVSYMALEVPMTRAWKDEASVWGAFLIAANEYLHRNKKGHHLHSGHFFDTDEMKKKGILDSAKRGKYVEKRIESFLAVYKK